VWKCMMVYHFLRFWPCWHWQGAGQRVGFRAADVPQVDFHGVVVGLLRGITRVLQKRVGEEERRTLVWCKCHHSHYRPGSSSARKPSADGGAHPVMVRGRRRNLSSGGAVGYPTNFFGPACGGRGSPLETSVGKPTPNF
jgi:hypothetical protein